MKAYLSMQQGIRAGANYLLDSSEESRLGRGLDCHVVVTDPLCSRVHAIIHHDGDGWWLTDAGSRNGTYVDGQKIDEARLVDGCTIRMGQDEFVFHSGEPQSPVMDTGNPAMLQTVVLDAPMAPVEADHFLLSSLLDEEHARNLLDLYQLSIVLLACPTCDDVLHKTLEVLQDKLQASIAGYLWATDDGAFKPKLVLPEGSSGKVVLSKTLTDLVLSKRRAIWVSNHSAARSASDSVSHYADAICIPLGNKQRVVGAVHLYREQGRFWQRDFEFAMSVANLLSVALDKTRRLMCLEAENQRLVDQTGAFAELLGQSPTMCELKSRITRIARASGCVLIRGESGCGKELVAQAIHRLSPRADRPMLSVNCAAIPRELMESQLFGHRKGAFTGADRDHVGWFQQADTSTLFLDEIGEMSLEGQAKLLRILEGHPFLPVGASREISVDVRVLAATNRDLGELVRDGRFREDLFYRLTVFELHVPPLRMRGEDIGLLIDHFFDHFRRQHGRPQLELSSEARVRMLAYQWPGNVRQLRNVIDSAVVMAEGAAVHPSDLGLREVVSGGLESLRVDYWEQKLIQEALQRTGGNVSEAAQLLGMGRATLYRKIEEYGLKSKA